MDISFVLIILLFGAAATYFVGNKWAAKAALIFSTAAFAAAIYVTCLFNQGEPVSFIQTWIEKPRIIIGFQADGLSLIMLLLTTALTPIIILSTFKNTIKNSRAFYALIMFMAFAMAGTFISVDGFVYYIFWELSLIPIYFISLIWGKGDWESRKKAVIKFFIYTFAGSLFMLVAFIYLYQRTGSFLNYKSLQSIFNA